MLKTIDSKTDYGESQTKSDPDAIGMLRFFRT